MFEDTTRIVDGQVPGIHDARLTVYEGGNAIRISQAPEDCYSPTRLGGGIRKAVTEFSKKSRRALIQFVNKTDRKKTFVFVTLTYEKNQQDGREAKANLHAFLQAMRRDFPAVSALWKAELQKRGAIHFHLLAWCRYLPKEWVAETWDRISGNRWENWMESTSTEVRAPKYRERSRRYLFAYMDKCNEPVEECDQFGRFWGVHERSKVPMASVVVVAISNETATAICRFWSDRWDQPWTLHSVNLYLSDSRMKKAETTIRGPTTILKSEVYLWQFIF